MSKDHLHPAGVAAMSQYKLDLAIRIALHVCVVLASCAGLSGCGASTAKVESTRQQLANILKADEQVDTEKVRECWIPGFKRGLAFLDGKTDADFSKPALFIAAFHDMGEKSGEAAQFTLFWLENGFEAAGVYVQNSDGADVASYRWPEDSADVKKQNGGRFYRDHFLRLVIKRKTPVSSSGTDAAPPAPPGSESIALEPSALLHPLNAGLIDKDGTKLPPIAVWIDPALVGHAKQENIIGKRNQ